jgi:very-short-patch-repair endonuclease
VRAKGARHRDIVLAEFADRQHGVVSRAQLMAAGVGRGGIARGVESRRSRPVFRGVYAVGHVALRREGCWTAALLACGSNAVLSHRTAALIWGLLVGPAVPVDVITTSSKGRKHAGITTHRIRLDPFDAVVIDDLCVTTPSRTIVDLAATLSGRALRDVVERAQDLRRFDSEDLRATLTRATRRPGARRLEDLLALMAPDEDRARSYLERLFTALTRKARLPPPAPNQQVGGLSRDFVWSDRRLVVETDGYRYHSSRSAKRRDNRRDRHLTALGWRPVRFTYEEIAFEPAEVARELKGLLHG